MPNQLAVPLKKTGDIRIRQTVHDYINTHRIDTNANAFKWDIEQWEKLRTDATNEVVHVSRIEAMLKYHAQLVFILTKLPPNVGLDVHYAPAFISSLPHVHLSNLLYERAAVLFNLAALYSQLGNMEDRSVPEGISRSVNHYQNAAGVFEYLRVNVLPKLKGSLAHDEHMPVDLTEDGVRSLESLMLAQAQEGVWQRAILDHLKNTVIAKLAEKVSSLYRESLTAIQTSESAIQNTFGTRWVAHIEVKHLHFAAAAQFRKSIDDMEGRRFGNQVVRLSEAKSAAEKGLDIGRNNGVASAVLTDIKSLLEKAAKEFKSAERDNDMIYHQALVAPSSLPAIGVASIAKSVIPKGLDDPKAVLAKENILFSDLAAWGAREAINVYEDRKANFIKDEILARVEELDAEANQTLHALGLPASLEALEKPIGLPPSLLKKAEEVRNDHGPEKIDSIFEDKQRLLQRNRDALAAAMDILDQEIEEDEAFQEQHPEIERRPSNEANQHLVNKYHMLQGKLNVGINNDDLLRGKWDEWAQFIEQLTWPEEELEAAVPSSTFSSNSSSRATKTHARTLRREIERIDDLQRARADLARRAQTLSDADDIRPVIMREAAGFERWAEVLPAMFETAIQDGVAKYAKFRDDIEAGAERQEQTLEEIKAANAAFIQSRKEDPVVKDRELALQSLDFAYHKYKEIRRDLTEAMAWHNNIGKAISSFKEDCKTFHKLRQADMRELLRVSSKATSERNYVHVAEEPAGASDLAQQSEPLQEPQPVMSPASPVPEPAVAQAKSVPAPARKVFNAPPPESDDWQTIAMPATPTRKPSAKKTKKKAVAE